MNRLDQASRLSSLIGHILSRDFPSRVHLAAEAGVPDGGLAVSLLPSPRFSICLSGTGRYHVMRGGELSDITLSRGDAIAVAPHCVMEPHPNSRYLALGIVFGAEVTRFLFAKKIPGAPRFAHRFLLSHHSNATLDLDLAHFLEALFRNPAPPTDSLYLRRLLALILLKAKHLSEEVAGSPTSHKARLSWEAACQYIHEHLSHPLNRSDVAGYLGVHPNHLSRLFTRFSGASFHHYLLATRLDRAQKLLKNPTLNISDISSSCGFTETNYFIRCFRRKFGQPPGRFRSGES